MERDEFAGLLPHRGAMSLLDRVLDWDEGRLVAESARHLDGDMPLRRGGRLSAICGAEFALQAAAVHGGLRGGGVGRPGYLATLRDVRLYRARLDEAGIGVLRIEVIMEHGDERALSYAMRVEGELGDLILEGRAMVLFAS